MVEAIFYWSILSVYAVGLLSILNSFSTCLKLAHKKFKVILSTVSFSVLIIFSAFTHHFIMFEGYFTLMDYTFFITSILLCVTLSIGVYAYTNTVKKLDDHEKYKLHYRRCKRLDLQKELMELATDRRENIKILNDMVQCINTLRSHTEQVRKRVHNSKRVSSEDESV